MKSCAHDRNSRLLKVSAATVALLLFVCSDGHAEDLPVGENAAVSIAPGIHKYSRVELGKHGTLRFSATTQIIADRVVAGEGAQIVYDSPAYATTDAFFTLSALDATGLTELTINTNGKAGPQFEKPAAAGAKGRNAEDPSVRDLDGKEAGSGGAGKVGAPGAPGESAIDVTLHLPNVPPGARVTINTVGGKGGNGQDGGKGGAGGSASRTHTYKCGGPGGAGGKGGDGGDAGKSYVFLIIPDDKFGDMAARKEAIETIRVTFNSSPGGPGSGGKGGTGGDDGGGHAVIDGSACARTASRAPDGVDGAMGTGPSEARPEEWARIDVMANSAYQQYIVQQLQQLRK